MVIKPVDRSRGLFAPNSNHSPDYMSEEECKRQTSNRTATAPLNVRQTKKQPLSGPLEVVQPVQCLLRRHAYGRMARRSS